jgi:hypothetical protein
MNKKLLMEILAIPSKTYEESAMIEWLLAYFKDKPYQCKRDAKGNVYVTKGTAGYYPCACSHTDTVWQPQKTTIIEAGDKLFAEDVAGSQVGCGGDDKAGIYICLQLLEKLPVLKAVFFVSEETGCHGARNSDTEWFLDVGYILEFDSPCDDIISFTSSGIRLFPLEGPFFDKMFPVLKRHGVLEWQHHPYTDVSVLKQKFSFPCMNLPAGYYRWHRHDEYVQMSVVDKCVTLGTDLIGALGNTVYSFDSRRDPLDEAKSPVKITQLKSHDFHGLQRDEEDTPAPPVAPGTVFGTPFAPVPKPALAKGDKVLMADGQVRAVEDIGCSDDLLGSDSKPLHVIQASPPSAPLATPTATQPSGHPPVSVKSSSTEGLRASLAARAARH